MVEKYAFQLLIRDSGLLYHYCFCTYHIYPMCPKLASINIDRYQYPRMLDHIPSYFPFHRVTYQQVPGLHDS